VKLGRPPSSRSPAPALRHCAAVQRVYRVSSAALGWRRLAHLAERSGLDGRVGLARGRLADQRSWIRRPGFVDAPGVSDTVAWASVGGMSLDAVRSAGRRRGHLAGFAMVIHANLSSGST